MNFRHKLIRTFYLFIFISISLLASIGFIVTDIFENTLLDVIVKFQYDEFFNSDQSISKIKIYSQLLSESDESVVPKNIHELAPGKYVDYEYDGKPYYILVTIDAGEKRWILFDETEIENRRDELRLFMLFGLIMIFFILYFVINALSKNLTASLTQLVESIGQLDPSNRNQYIAEHDSVEEIYFLSKAINRFLSDLNSFIARENEFINLASHELRTPLAVISGAAEILDATPGLPSQAIGPIARIRRSAASTEKITSLLLRLAKYQSSENIQTEDFFLDVCIKRVVEELENQIQFKNIAIKIDSPAQLLIHTSQTGLELVLTNLIKNSLTHSGTHRIRITATQNTISVRDYGKGMVELPLSYASGSFGLFLCRKICNHANWGLSIKNIPSGGIEAIIDLQLNERD